MQHRSILRYFLIVLLLLASSRLLSAEPHLAEPGDTPVYQRVALVIGNTKYSKNALVNPVNDATDMYAVLKSCGFDVTVKYDRSASEMVDDIDDFRKKLTPTTVALFYYAGHAVQFAGENYLLPVNFVYRSSDQMPFDTVSANRVLEVMRGAKTPLNIVILDACRVVPVGMRGDGNRGLNFMNPPSGTLIAFATAAGHTADDRPGDRNGLFTGVLLEELRKPGQTLLDVFNNVSLSVADKSNSEQEPWVSSSRIRPFYFLSAALPIPVFSPTQAKDLLTLKGHTDSVRSLAFSPDGKHILTASDDKTAKIWDASTRKVILTFKGHTESVRSATFSPDGRCIVTGSTDKTATVWDATSGNKITTLKGHSGLVLSASFSPDGRRILTGSTDNTAKVWNVTTGKVITTLKGPSSWICSASFSPDGKRIVTADHYYTATVWDATTGNKITTLKGHSSLVFSASFSPDGRRILTGSTDKTATVWDAITGSKITTLNGHTDSVWSTSFSPDGRHILTASWDNTAKLWDADTGQAILTLKGHSDDILSAIFSPDGKRILTGSRDKTVKVWELQ